MMLKGTDLSDNLKRLEQILDLLDEDAMLLTELDGFLCGLAVGPQAIPQSEWIEEIWSEEADFAAHNIDQTEFVALIEERAKAVADELAKGSYAPLFDVEDETGEIGWELWLVGFETAMAMRLKSWERLFKHPPTEKTAQAMEILSMALTLAGTEPDPKDWSEKELEEYKTALAKVPEALPVAAMLLHQARLQKPAPVRVASVGRNDPCPCGSGKKYKHCHGASA